MIIFIIDIHKFPIIKYGFFIILAISFLYLHALNRGKRAYAGDISFAQEQYARELPSADAFIVSAVWTDTSSLWVQVDPFNCHCNDWKYLAKKFARTIAKEAADTLGQSVCVHTYIGEFEEVGSSCQGP